MIKPWTILSSTDVFSDEYLTLRTDQCARADGHIVPAYHVIEQTDWATIIPLTDAGNIVLIREYRHAAQQVVVGLPGGVSDPGETDWQAVAERELREETGYIAQELICVGSCYPNPAVQDNLLHYFVAFGCRPGAGQALDPNEEIEVLEMPYSEFLDYGRFDIQHGLHAAGLFYAEQYFRANPTRRPGV